MNPGQNPYPDAPPPYQQAIQMPIQSQPGGFQDTMTSVPATGYYPSAPPNQMYPQQGGYMPPQQGGYMPPQHGYMPPPHGEPPKPGFVPSYGSIETRTTIIPPTEIIVVGGCPVCRIGILEDDFTCCGICCAIFLFPVGILCCLAMKEKRCSNCGTRI